MKQLLFCVLIFLGHTIISFGQCLCGEITFQLNAKDLRIENDSTNYSVEVTVGYIGVSKYSFDFHLVKSNVEGKKLKFSVATGGGIDTLKVVIKNLTTKEEMIVTTTTLHFDLPYEIDLLGFTKGDYVFHWKEIAACVGGNNRNEKIVCGEMKFFHYSNGLSIKPVDLKCFRQKSGSL